MANPNSRDIKAVATAVADTTGATALFALVDRGCDREELLRLLARLHHAHVARRRATKRLKRLARTLETAAAGIGELPAWRGAAHLGLPDDAKTWLDDCSHDLQLLAETIRSRLKAADSEPDDDVRIERAKARLVEHVMSRSGQPNDTAVATLIDAVLVRPQKRSRDRDERSAGPVDQTADSMGHPDDPLEDPGRLQQHGTVSL
jgi:hypothetical protein